MKKKNTWILLVILAVLAVTGIGGAFLIQNKASEKVYTEKMTEGRKYLSQMKYEEAVAAFEFALKENPEDESAYVAIYRVRAAQGEMELAREILEEGYEKTKSKRLSKLLSDNMEKTEAAEASSETEDLTETLERKLQEVTMNTAMFQKLTNYNYSSYKKEFGRPVSSELQGSSLEVVHGKIQAIFVYQNAAGEEKSIDSAKKLPKDMAKPAYIQLQNPGLLFKNFDSGVTFDRLCEIVGSKVVCRYSREADSYVDVFTYGDCEVEIACEENGDITEDCRWNKIVPPESKVEGEKVPTDGVIVNAVTGEGIENALLVFEPEDRSLEKEEARTDRQGRFAIELSPGVYQVRVSCDGFIEDSFPLEVEEGTPVSGIPFTLSPMLLSGEIRIVLTWNAYPTDLDSHLAGTSISGKRMEIYFGRKHAEDRGEEIAVLDVDETSGFGPETTTIYMDGSYDFWVEDFTHSGEIGSSGAVVKVYSGNSDTPEIFEVPSGSGNVWNVFSIENGVIHPSNTITE